MKKITIVAVCTWLFAVACALLWNIYDQNQAKRSLAFHTARAFFKQIVVTRSWNAGHGGVYVLVSKETQPNMYLDDPLRDLSTVEHISLTKINPAFMTRQISEISSQLEDGIQFHITSLNPIRPGNKATDWEQGWLDTFEQGAKERGAFLKVDTKSYFRYMAPLSVEENCLKCHAKQGYKKGDIRGGISITLPHFSQDISNGLVAIYIIGALIGTFFILVAGSKLESQRQQVQRVNESLKAEVEDRQKAFNKLQEATEEVNQLKGIIPICMHCKEIRDDEGFWNRFEHYIESHSEAQFSHSICEACLDKFYPEENED